MQYGFHLPADALIALRVLLGLVFLEAAWGKMRHWTVLEGVIANYRLLPAMLVKPATWLLPPSEALLGLALLLHVATPWPEALAAALLTAFALAMAVNLARGRRHIDCGCFQGALRQRLRWALVARNLALTVLCAALLAPPAAAPGASAAWIIFNGVMSGLVLALTLQSLNALWSIDPAWRRPRPASNDTAGGMA